MRIAKHMQGAVTVVELAGELDSATAASARDELVRLVGDGGLLLLDLSGLSYMSSAGLRVMLLIYRQARTSGARLALAGIPNDIRTIMAATGFLDFFTVVDTVAAGLEELEE